MKFQEIEQIIKKDGWRLKTVNGSHYHYVHVSKPGKVTIPYHGKELHKTTVESILKQAGLR
jgi:predicted RNA binding protein YcfA (HicA-like mRNA interferase family)